MPSWFDQVLAPSEGNDYRAWTDQFREMNPTSGGPYPTRIPSQQGDPYTYDMPDGTSVPFIPTMDPRMAGGIQPSGSQPDYRSIFMGIVGNGMATPEALLAKEAELAQAGIKVLRNASGVAGKVQLPSGEIVDVIQSAGTGGGVAPFQWNQGRGGPTGEGGRPLPGNQFYGQGTAPLSRVASGPNYGARLPALEQTPGYQFRLNQGLDAVQKSAAAKGTLLSGGTLKDLTEFSQGLASTEFNNEFGRNASLADLGLRAAGAQGAYGTAYGDQLTDLTTGAGNARAAGTVGSGNAWTTALGNIGQGATDLYGMWRYGQRQPPPYYYG